MRRHLRLLRLAGVEPPLAGERHHPDQHLRVQRRGLGVERRARELVGEQVLDLGGDVGDQARERPGRLPGRAVAHQDAEAVGRALDVVEQGQGGPLERSRGCRRRRRGRP